MFMTLIFLIFPFCMVFAIVSDFISMQISNKISIILLLSFAIIAPFTDIEPFVYMQHFLVGFGVLFLGFILFSFRFCGGGDVKLLASISLWIGWNELFIQFIYLTSIWGAILSVFIISYKKSSLPYVIRDNIFLRQLNYSNDMPYGCALGSAALAVYPHSYLGVWIIDLLAI